MPWSVGTVEGDLGPQVAREMEAAGLAFRSVEITAIEEACNHRRRELLELSPATLRALLVTGGLANVTVERAREGLRAPFRLRLPEALTLEVVDRPHPNSRVPMAYLAETEPPTIRAYLPGVRP